MLHPYSIFFKALWEEPTTRDQRRDDPVAARTPHGRWRLWWRYADTRRAAAAQDQADSVPSAADTRPDPADARRGGIRG